MISDKTYSCQIYTLDGTFPAIAKINPIRGKHETVKIKSECGKYSMNVYRSLAERKFWNEESPVFYSC